MITKENKSLSFPENFLWGAGTSAFQVEGGNIWNDWYHFYKKYKMEMDGCGGKTSDHYERFREDFDLAKSLNQNAQRISIEWSRIEKKKGVIDKNEIEHYKEVLKYLRDNGFTTIVTLHHFTNPTWFSNEGGWGNSKASNYFANYTSVVIEELGNFIDYWIILNEPYMYAGLSCLLGKWAPEKNNPFLFKKVVNNLVKTHKKAYKLIHDYKTDAKVGIASNIMPFVSSCYIDRFFQSIFDKFFNFYFLDKIKKHLDFIGLNYYYPISILNLSKKRTDLNWQIYPKGIFIATTRVWKRYKKPIMITENGIADEKDLQRESFIREHVTELQCATESGVPVIGYLYWSLLDNLELTEGFWPKFGLIEVDYKTHSRRIRESAKYYAKICESNSLQSSVEKELIVKR